MNFDFTGKSIKCETWEQMLHLADLCKGQGMVSAGFSHKWFKEGGIYFETTSKKYYINLKKPQEDNVINYAMFMIVPLPTETIEVTGCDGCIFHQLELYDNMHRCIAQGILVEDKTELFTTCLLKTKSITIKLKNNEPTGN